MSYASEVPLRIAIKESQRNSDIFSNSSTPSSGTPRTTARFDRNASTVFGGSWGDQQQQQQSPSNGGRIDRMASDIFNTNYNHHQQGPSNNKSGGTLKKYQPSFLDSHHHHPSSSSSKRTPEQHEGDSLKAYHQQQSSLDESSHLDEAYARYQSMQNEQLKQASPMQRRQGTPYSHNSYERDDNPSSFQEYESCMKPPSHGGREYQSAKPSSSLSLLQNTFADHVPVSAMKRTDHHKHTSIFNDFGSCDSPRVNAAVATSASMNARHCAAPAADFNATTPPPTVPTQAASTNRANSVSSNSVFPNNSFGDTLQQFGGTTDVPRSGRRHFQVSSRSSIFSDSNEQVGMNMGSSASLGRRGAGANSGEDFGRNDGPFPGSNPNSDHYASSQQSASVNFGTSDGGRSGGLSSSDLNRERVGRGRRQAFETSQIFF
ncbi:hypothetical protein BJ741DRAFT_603114 [Chytriomyces cf. hyalinus JEL632]|nr:hypothetical protein BJ741DRAFT_603114 [Chytriomyces cf. hyalinus JEL632]